MTDSLCQEILQAILTADTHMSLDLLRKGKSIFLDPVKGITFHAEALYCAIKKNNEAVIQFLSDLPVRSDIAFFKFCGNTPLGMAIEDDHLDLLPLLLKKTDKNFALHMAVKFNQSKSKQVLLQKYSFKKKFLGFLELQS